MNKWIPCSERLPERGGDYLITYLEDGCCDHIAIKIEPFWNERFPYWQSEPDEHVLAWMELPEPYEEPEEEEN